MNHQKEQINKAPLLPTPTLTNRLEQPVSQSQYTPYNQPSKLQQPAITESFPTKEILQTWKPRIPPMTEPTDKQEAKQPPADPDTSTPLPQRKKRASWGLEPATQETETFKVDSQLSPILPINNHQQGNHSSFDITTTFQSQSTQIHTTPHHRNR